jgi:hypothetical protein
MKRFLTILLSAVMLLCLFGCAKTEKEEVPKETLDPDTVYYADIVIADYGSITVQLDQKAAPITVAARPVFCNAWRCAPDAELMRRSSAPTDPAAVRIPATNGANVRTMGTKRASTMVLPPYRS